MPMIRSLRQPGPVHPNRIDRCRGDVVPLTYTLLPGLTLNEAVTGPLVEAGFQCGTVVFQDLTVGPFRYVMPGPADGESHVAYFSAPRAPEGITRIERANVTFGWADGKPFSHCHAVWVEPDGRRRGGHILTGETLVADAGQAAAWGFREVRIEAIPDPETNFTLFQPSGGEAGRDLVVRVKPNEDIISALEAIGLRNAVVRGSLGSLIGAGFVDGRRIRDHATEVLVRQGISATGWPRWICWWWTCAARCMKGGCGEVKTLSALRSICSWRRWSLGAPRREKWLRTSRATMTTHRLDEMLKIRSPLCGTGVWAARKGSPHGRRRRFGAPVRRFGHAGRRRPCNGPQAPDALIERSMAWTWAVSTGTARWHLRRI